MTETLQDRLAEVIWPKIAQAFGSGFDLRKASIAAAKAVVATLNEDWRTSLSEDRPVDVLARRAQILDRIVEIIGTPEVLPTPTQWQQIIELLYPPEQQQED